MMATHNADHLIAGTDIAPGAQTNPMNFSALWFAASRDLDCDVSSREIFAASAWMSAWLTRCPGRGSLWPSTNY